MTEKGESLPTSYHLPTVKPETADALLGTAVEIGAKEFIGQAYERLQVHNPELANAVAQFAMGRGVNSPEQIQLCFDIMLVTHELLQNQAEADTLNQNIA